MDWKDCSMIKSTDYSFRGPTQVQFPAPAWQLTTVCNSTTRGDDIHAGKTYAHKINNNFKKIK